MAQRDPRHRSGGPGRRSEHRHRGGQAVHLGPRSDRSDHPGRSSPQPSSWASPRSHDAESTCSPSRRSSTTPSTEHVPPDKWPADDQRGGWFHSVQPTPRRPSAAVNRVRHRGNRLCSTIVGGEQHRTPRDGGDLDLKQAEVDRCSSWGVRRHRAFRSPASGGESTSALRRGSPRTRRRSRDPGCGCRHRGTGCRRRGGPRSNTNRATTSRALPTSGHAGRRRRSR